MCKTAVSVKHYWKCYRRDHDIKQNTNLQNTL